jgi:protein O-GlcNAc transferase
VKSKRKKAPAPSDEILILKKGEQALSSGSYGPAAGYFSRISDRSPNYGRACKGNGAALLRMFRWRDALDALQLAHEAFPADSDILVDGGDAARMLGGLDVAEAAYEAARKLGADGFQIRFGEAMICQDRKCWIKAIDLWTKLRATDPSNSLVVHNLGKAWHELGETDRAVSLMLESYASSGDKTTLTMLGLLAPHAGMFGHEDVRRIRTKLGEQLRSDEGDPRDSLRPEPNGCVNIGYVSAFFHRRNWMKPVWALLNDHDRDAFKIHLFADGPPDEIDSEGGYSRHAQDSIYDTRKLSNRDLAKLISDRRINVLVDLNGYSAIPRLGLWTAKPAPVTIAWFNQYATSGLPGIEWLIGDDVVIHPEEEKFYAEKIVRLKQSYLTFQVGYATPDIEIPADEELFTYGCLGSAYKITPEVRDAWIKLLKETEGTRMIVRNRVLGADDHREWFLEFFVREGIAPERVILLGPADHDEFLRTYGKIDLALDTFPYNGGTTTMEALWQGVPIVCFTGDRWVSRTSATILNSADMHDFVGENINEYVEIAKKWNAPAQRDSLRQLRNEMRRRLNSSKGCDGLGLARDFERIVIEILRSSASDPAVGSLNNNF